MTDKVRILTNQERNSVRITKDNEIIISILASDVTVQHFEDGSVCYSPVERRTDFDCHCCNTEIEGWSNPLKTYTFNDIISGAVCLTSDGYPFKVRYIMKEDCNSEEITGRFLVQFMDGSFKEFDNINLAENTVFYHSNEDIDLVVGKELYLCCFKHPFVVKGIDNDIVTLSNIDLDSFVNINKSYLKDLRLTEDIVRRGVFMGALLPWFELKKVDVLKSFDEDDDEDDDISSYKGEMGATKDGFSYIVIRTSEANNELTVKFNIDKSIRKLSFDEYKAGFNYKDRLKNIKEGDYITIPYFKKKCKITRITEKCINFYSEETNEIHRVSKAQLEMGFIPYALYKRLTKDRK